MDGGAGASATPIYNKFVGLAKKLKGSYISMITPSRWFAGGKGLDAYRDEMINDNRISKIVNFANGKDCFPTASTGSISYFLWDKNYCGDCCFKSILNGQEDICVRPLNEFEILISNNKAISIIHKVLSLGETSFSDIVRPYKPFGLRSYVRGRSSKKQNDVILYSSDGTSYIDRSEITACQDIIDKYKIMTSKLLAEHAGEPDKSGRYRVLSRTEIISINTACTESYLILGAFDSIDETKHCYKYCCSRFFRFLLLQFMSSINMTKEVFRFVPLQDFTKPWTDEELYKKYNLTDEEIAFIESMIKPME